jgi:PKD repeat protein
MKKFNYLAMTLLVLGYIMFSFSSCKEDPKPVPTVKILSASIGEDGYTVAFTIAATDADTYAWDFGDNAGTSTEMNPTYTYPVSGTYTAKVTVTGAGGSAEATIEITIAASQEEMLSGTWIADGGTNLLATEIFGDGTDDEELPVGTIGAIVPDLTADKFKFNTDGSYEIIDDGNGQIFSAAMAAAATLQTQTPWAIDPEHPENGGNEHVSTPLSIVGEYAICAFDYTPPANATWELKEDQSVTVKSDDDTPVEKTFEGDALVFSAGSFIGMYNIPTVTFIRELTAEKLTVELFFNADGGDPAYTNYTVTLSFRRPE